MKSVFIVMMLAVVAASSLSSHAYAKEIAITCTFEGSYDDAGYKRLAPTEFSVLITENTDGVATSASVSDTPLCPYTTILTYNTELIHFSDCSRPSWLAADRPTPEGYLKINRYTGAFEQYTNFPDVDGWLMQVGTCKGGSRKF